jgi:cytochrome P450
MIIDAVCARGECDFATEIATALPIAVICDLMGVPEADRAEISRLSRASHPLCDGTFDDAYRAVRELITYGKELLRARLESPSDDLTTVLAAAEIDHERLGDDDAGTFFELLVTAGTDTTGAAIAHGLIALCDNPDQLGQWQADFRQIAPTAIEEILRWSTPVVHFRRTASVDTELGGQDIAAGDKIVVFYNSANRDEAVFKAPERFDVMRSTNPHVTFGGVLISSRRPPRETGDANRIRATVPAPPGSCCLGSPTLMHSMFFNGVNALPCEFTPRRRKARS